MQSELTRVNRVTPEEEVPARDRHDAPAAVVVICGRELPYRGVFRTPGPA